MLLPHGSFLGRPTLVREVGPFRVTETRYAAGTRLPRHRHRDGYLCLVVQGGFVEHGSTALATHPGSVLSHPPGSHHEDEFLPRPGTCLNVETDPRWRERSLGTPRGEAHCVHWSCADSERLVHAIATELRAADAVSSLRLDGLLRELLAGVEREQRAGARGGGTLVEAAKACVVRAEPGGQPTIAEVARTVGVHPSHLHRVFREAEGTSIGEWMRRRRVEQCARLLRNSQRSLACIAAETGFADQSHMTRTLRRYLGATPRALRRGAADSTLHS